MYQGMVAQLTLTSDDGDDDAFKVTKATASHGECKMDGNVLAYTPPGHFVGSAVVSYTASGTRGAADQALPPPWMPRAQCHRVNPNPGHEGTLVAAFSGC